MNRTRPAGPISRILFPNKYKHDDKRRFIVLNLQDGTFSIALTSYVSRYNEFLDSAYCYFRLFRMVKSLVYSLFDITIHKIPIEDQINGFSSDRRSVTSQVQLLIYFMLKYAMEVLLSESSVVTTYYFNWTTSTVSVFLACLGLTVLPVNIIVGSYISNMFEDR